MQATGYTVPQTNVGTGTFDISAPSLTLRLDGSQAATSASSQGTGTYGNYPLFLMSRNQASSFFNGRLYELIVRGAQSSTQQITNTENWIAGKMDYASPSISGVPTIAESS